MKYLINGTIIFDSEGKNLTKSDGTRVVALSSSVSRLLRVIIESDAIEFKKDYLIDKIWTEYGLKGTDGNLRQCISTLRRELISLDSLDLIVTIKGVGFRIAPSTKITPFCEHANKSNVLPILLTKSLAFSSENFRILLSLGMVIIIMVFIVTGFDIIKPYEFSAIPLAPGCNVIHIKIIDKNEKEKYIKRITEVFTRKNLSCRPGEYMVYSINNSGSSKNISRELLAICHTDKNDGFISCENYYFYGREENAHQ